MGLRLNHISASDYHKSSRSALAGTYPQINALAVSGAAYFEPTIHSGMYNATTGIGTGSAFDVTRGFPAHPDAAYIFSGTVGGKDKSLFLGDVVVSGSLSLGGGGTFLEGAGASTNVAFFQDADTVTTGTLKWLGRTGKQRLVLGEATADGHLHTGSSIFLETENSIGGGMLIHANDIEADDGPPLFGLLVTGSKNGVGHKLGLSSSVGQVEVAGTSVGLAATQGIGAMIGGASIVGITATQTTIMNDTVIMATGGTDSDPDFQVNGGYSLFGGVVDIDGNLDVDNVSTAIKTSGRLELTSSMNDATAIKMFAEAGGIDIKATGGAGEDIAINNGAGSITLNAGEAQGDAIVIAATSGNSGIDIAAGSSANQSNANIDFSAMNNVTIDAQGTDNGDGVSITLGSDSVSTQFAVHGNSATNNNLFVVSGSGAVRVAGDLEVAGGDIKLGRVGAFTLGSDLGANDLTLGASTTTVVVPGDLKVQGTTTTVDTANLFVKDPFIYLGDGAQSLDSNAGILFASSSHVAARPEVVFARKASGVWGLGSIDGGALSGSITSAQTMTHDIGFQVGSLTGSTVTLSGLTNNRIVIAGASGLLEDDANLAFDGTNLEVGAGFAVAQATGIARVGGIIASTAGAADVGSATAEMGDFYIFDDKEIKFGSDQDVTIGYANGTNALIVSGSAAVRIEGNNREIQFNGDNKGISASGTSLKLKTNGDVVVHTANGSAVLPENDDQTALGSGSKQFSDLFLGSGAVVNFNNGNTTVTQSAKALLVGGAAADVKLQLGDADSFLQQVADGNLLIESNGGTVDNLQLHANHADGGIRLRVNAADFIVADGSSPLMPSTAAAVVLHKTTIPATDNAVDLGSNTQRFANIYTGDLNLRNDRGDWTLIEEEDFISFRNNKTGRRFRMVMEDITGLGIYGPGNDGEM